MTSAADDGDNKLMEPLALSIVIAMHDDARAIVLCLSALEAQLDRRRSEIILATCCSSAWRASLAQDFPNVTLLHFDTPLTLPYLRGRAIACSRGAVIAVLDPCSIPAPHWAQLLLQAHVERTNAVIGGTVDLYEGDSASLMTWATYLNEYGGFMPPRASGPVAILPGSNLSYKRGALGNLQQYTRLGFWKTFVNQELKESGDPLWLTSSLTIMLFKPIAFSDFLWSRYHHGRCYAAMRVECAPASERLWRTLSAPLLPMAFLMRQLRHGLPNKRLRRKLLLTLPLQVIVFVVWAFGEMCGYALGEGGSSRHLVY